jgi:hypothetical protein
MAKLDVRAMPDLMAYFTACTPTAARNSSMTGAHAVAVIRRGADGGKDVMTQIWERVEELGFKAGASWYQ